MPETVEKEAMRELDRLSKIPPASPEYGVIRTYLDWVCELPWSIQTDRQARHAAGRADPRPRPPRSREGQTRILEYLAVRKLNPTGKSPILCFVGPPGVGKTSPGQVHRRRHGPQVRPRLAGRHARRGRHPRPPPDLHRRHARPDHPGAAQGREPQPRLSCSTKWTRSAQISAATPPAPCSKCWTPRRTTPSPTIILDLPFDLSKVMFIATANTVEPIPPALRDRMEVIEMPGYTETEKLKIAKKYLVPRQLREHGLKKRN